MSILSQEHKERARWALQTALDNGCQDARVIFVTGVSNSFEYRDLQLDSLESSTESQLYIELFVDRRYGSFSSNKLDREDLEIFIKDAIESVRYLAEDPCRELPTPERYYSGNTDLELLDADYFTIETDAKLEVLRNAINEIYGAHEDIISISADYNDSISSVYMLTSNGFENQSDKTSYSLVVSVSLRTENDSRSEAYWYDIATHWDKLHKEGLGKTALQKALDKVGQKKIASGSYDMLLDNTTTSRLLSPLISALYGASIQQKNSFLIDRLGDKIASDMLTIIDRPHRKGALGARLYDGEGVATGDRVVLEKGVLKSYYVDTYNANKLRVEPTIASSTGLCIELGEKSHDELIESIVEGIWVTGFNGGNSNPTTGDFSFGVDGFLIQNGKIVKPISEMNITGNLLDLWTNIKAIGNNPRENIASQLPSVLFENVNFSGF